MNNNHIAQGEYKVFIELNVCGYNEDDIKEQLPDFIGEEFKIISIKENPQYRKERQEINALFKGGFKK